ncbi:DUF6185 family protein [Streptomyces sp. NPDC059761]|uniref:DUF6185 family protein n=1 Tax=Streptomyces sp. NPDC059761 TaxID=3346937 RepID=UPI00364AEDF9
MIHLRRHALFLLPVLVLVLYAALAVSGTARAAESRRAVNTCTPDRLKGTKVKTTVEFAHRGSDVSSVSSVTDITVPTEWEQAPHLLLDTHAAEYRDALRCLLGKGASAEETESDETDSNFYDYEWRFRPLSVRRDGNRISIHYEAVAWVQDLSAFQVGLWTLTPDKNEWAIKLKRPPSFSNAMLEEVHVRLGGPGAMSVWPPTTVGKGHSDLTWMNPDDGPQVVFRPPAAQQWTAIAQSHGTGWEALGTNSASGAFAYFATGALSLIAGHRLRRDLGRRPLPVEEEAFTGLRYWALILMLIGLLVFMSDDLYNFLNSRFVWKYDYGPTVSLFSMLLIGVVLCFFGKLRRFLLVAVCALAASLLSLYLAAELSDVALVSTSDVTVSHVGARLVVMASAVPIFVCCLGFISSGQRLLLLHGRGLPQWVMVCVAAGMSGLTVLWAFLAFGRSWERRTWLTNFAPSVLDWNRLNLYDWWWYWFATNTLSVVGDIVGQLAPLALVGVLRVCRAEQYDNDSFTPNAAERSFMVIFFAVIVVPNYAYYFGFSGYVTTLVLGIFAAWALLALGQSRSVLEQPAAGDAPLGKMISRTDRSELLRMAHRYRELQARLHRHGAGASTERSEQEAVEQEIDRLDQCLPDGVRPIDLPFAFGPMATWWGNACRCALIACFIGLPATGLMYWLDVVRGDSWSLTVEDIGGFLRVVLEILYWQIIWVAGGFFLGALWRDLPGRNGPMKALSVAAAFAVPIGVHEIIAQMIGQGLQNTVPAIAAFASVMTFSGLVMDVQTFKSERRYRSSNASLLVYIYQMRIASVAFLLAQLVALATIWQSFTKGGPPAPPSAR